MWLRSSFKVPITPQLCRKSFVSFSPITGFSNYYPFRPPKLFSGWSLTKTILSLLKLSGIIERVILGRTINISTTMIHQTPQNESFNIAFYNLLINLITTKKERQKRGIKNNSNVDLYKI